MNARIDELLDQLYHPELKIIDPGLDRVVAFLELLGSPHKRIPPVIHVAGTNGKGSLVANLHAIFEAAGYSVHRYTSPHLVRFNERIVLNGKPITDDYLESLLKTLMGYIKDQPVTFFEATTAAAFMAFAEHKADVVLLETGMGGRLDATNVIDKPLLTAITPIGLDHCNFLGDTLSEIAFEKAGIIKHSVPCVIGRQSDEVWPVLQKAAQSSDAPLYRFDHEWQVVNGAYQSANRAIALKPALAGVHQLENAATAAACMDQLPQFTVTNAQIEQGIAHAVWPARLQHLSRGYYTEILPQGMELWLDGGHNPHGAHAISQWLIQRDIPNVYVICGMVQGKDTMEFLSILAPCITKLYAINIPDEATSQPAHQIEMAARGAGIAAESALSIENALQSIATHAKTPALVCILGSLYLAGKVLAKN